MYSGVKANEKHDGGNEKILRLSGDPLLTPYIPLIGVKFYFRIWACGVCTVGSRPTRNTMMIMKNVGSSGDPLLTPYSPKILLLYMTLYLPLKLYIGKLPGVAGYFASI